ncbi:MAG: DoxX family membrane protein [bacterium]|nr:DoxX family membrane protein [bacterium]
MLNPFPQLLDFAFFAPLLLRVAVAIVLMYLAYKLVCAQGEITKIRFPILGKPGAWLVWARATIEVLVALALLLGYYTQIAAGVAMVLAIKHFVFARRYPTIIPLSRATYSLLFVICLSLLLTGAGAWAIDIPL